MAGGSDGLRIIDVSNPSSPKEVGFYDTGGFTRGVAVSGQYVYMADIEDGLRIIDVSNPANPKEVGYYNTGGYAQGVAVSGHYVYVAGGSDGLYILKLKHSSVGITQHNTGKDILIAPNPSHGNFMVILKGEEKYYKVTMINSTGKVIIQRNLLSNSGQHQFSVNRSYLPAGMYFLRFESKDKVVTRKILIK